MTFKVINASDMVNTGRIRCCRERSRISFKIFIFLNRFISSPFYKIEIAIRNGKRVSFHYHHVLVYMDFTESSRIILTELVD